MSKNSHQDQVVIGVEGGGTHTVAVAMNAGGKVVARWEFGPGNIAVLSPGSLQQLIACVHEKFARFSPAGIGFSFAGLKTNEQRALVQKIANKFWPQVPILIVEDTLSGLTGALGTAPGIFVICGTGSNVFGRNRKGETLRVGGWGHVLGDSGSGYDIALRGLRKVIQFYDEHGNLPLLGRRFLHSLGLNSLNDLSIWSVTATKTQIAALAVDVYFTAGKKDRISTEIIQEAAQALVCNILLCSTRLGFKKSDRIPISLGGGIPAKQPAFLSLMRRLIRGELPNAIVNLPMADGACGAALLMWKKLNQNVPPTVHEIKKEPFARHSAQTIHQLSVAATEQTNPRTSRIDQVSTSKAVELLLNEEVLVVPAIRSQVRNIAATADVVAAALKKGGRLFYVGAGTSGRLGVLDAVECPPTFSSEPEQIQGIIAGGMAACWRAVEGAEDDVHAGEEAIRFKGVGKHDVVVGIAASGRTPFVIGALEQAARSGAKTVWLTFNPKHPPLPIKPDISIVIETGPEAISGSTRLKAGTATKITLNCISTAAMIRRGKVMKNLMVDVKPTNLKLKHRAQRLVQQLTKSGSEESWQALERTRWNIRDAVKQICGKPKSPKNKGNAS